MITIANKGRDETFVKYRGLSTDTKPTDCPNGSEFFEMNTGKTSYFNEASSTWVDPTA
jgi:hypothetical protein